MGGSVPLGYNAIDRALHINADEAETVRRVYQLYEELGTVRRVKVATQRTGLRSKVRIAANGRRTGGSPLGRGHIHHILTNPIYAGRIRHKTEFFPGQHNAIIVSERWDRIQQMLQAKAAKPRATKNGQSLSPLAGKIFDETGDRLTPTHTKTRKGVRLRYYVSYRLIKLSGDAAKDGWRLPAVDLEAKIAELVASHLSTPKVASVFMQWLPPVVAQRRDETLNSKRTDQFPWSLIKRIDLQPGRIKISFDEQWIQHQAQSKNQAQLPQLKPITSPFQLRKRGVETKIVIAGATRETDDILILKLARAFCWYEQVKAGKTFAEIAKEAGVNTSRIRQMIDLAFLAPDIVRDILNGDQPIGLTFDWARTNALPIDWQAQRDSIAKL
ncbi:MAG: recombinase family protein [Pseudomonadota bacterium]